jgi:uroporphyrinogen decarboxylase
MIKSLVNGRERIEALLAGKPVDRPPFVPAVYEHKAALVGSTPSAVARNTMLLEQALARELELYEPDALTVGLDVYNVEAEAVGAKVRYFDGADVPVIEDKLVRPGQDVGFLPLPNPERSGRMPAFLEAGRRLQAYAGDEVLVRGALSGPYSMAAELVGDEALIIALMDQPDWVASLLDFCAVAIQAYGRAFVRRGLGVMLFDSHAAPPLISPSLYRRIILPPTVRVVSYFRSELGVPLVPYIIGGDTTPLLPGILETGTNNILCDFKADLARFMELVADPAVIVRANLDPRFLLAASTEEIEARTAEILAVGRRRPGFMLGTGILPFDIPSEKVLAVRRALIKSATALPA